MILLLVVLAVLVVAFGTRCAVRGVHRARAFDRLGTYGGYRRVRDPIDPVT